MFDILNGQNSLDKEEGYIGSEWHFSNTIDSLQRTGSYCVKMGTPLQAIPFYFMLPEIYFKQLIAFFESFLKLLSVRTHCQPTRF